MKVAHHQGAFTIFGVVDALARPSAKLARPGQRSEAGQKASEVLPLAE